MGKINWIRAIGVGVVFGLIYTLSPKFIVGFFIGYMLMLVVIRIEELAPDPKTVIDKETNSNKEKD